jgi:glutathione S-transferase
VLTELGLDFVARQVEPWPKDRAELKAVAGTDQIPVLQVENGSFFRGAREIFGHLRERDPSKDAAAHRRRFAHTNLRGSPTSPASCSPSSMGPTSFAPPRGRPATPRS